MKTAPPNRLSHVRRFVGETPWAMLPSALDVLIEVVERRAASIELDEAEIAARVEAARRAPVPAASAGGVAVIPIRGPIVPRASAFSEVSDLTSAENVGRALSAALANPDVGSILLDIDSPGGNVQGIPELAEQIRSASGQKPVVAMVNHLAASAAYWLASAASEIVATRSADVGSIGVFTVHDDLSAMAEKAGVRRTYVAAGKFKTEGNPFGPLSEEARAHLQERVDAVYRTFVKDIGAGRRVSQETVRETFGQGRLVGAEPALKSGMVDRIGTMDETLARLVRRGSSTAGAKAEAAPGLPAAGAFDTPAEPLEPADGELAYAELGTEPEAAAVEPDQERERLRLRAQRARLARRT